MEKKRSGDMWREVTFLPKFGVDWLAALKGKLFTNGGRLLRGNSSVDTVYFKVLHKTSLRSSIYLHLT